MHCLLLDKLLKVILVVQDLLEVLLDLADHLFLLLIPLLVGQVLLFNISLLRAHVSDRHLSTFDVLTGKSKLLVKCGNLLLGIIVVLKSLVEGFALLLESFKGVGKFHLVGFSCVFEIMFGL